MLSASVANVLVGFTPGIRAGDLDAILRVFATLGPALVADKVEDAVERGIMLFLDGTVFYSPSVAKSR